MKRRDRNDDTRYRHVNTLSAEEIRAEFVEDGIRQTPTPLPRFVIGVERMARLRGVGQEQVYTELQSETRALTGHGLPVA